MHELAVCRVLLDQVEEVIKGHVSALTEHFFDVSVT